MCPFYLFVEKKIVLSNENELFSTKCIFEIVGFFLIFTFLGMQWTDRQTFIYIYAGFDIF